MDDAHTEESTKKKIAIDARMWGAKYTGIGNYLQETATRLFKRFADHEFILFVTPENLTELEVPANVTKVLAPEKIYSVGEQAKFLMRLRNVNADLTWFPHFNVPIGYRKKYVVTVHDLTLLTYQGKKMKRRWHQAAYRAILRNCMRRSEKVIAVSEYTKEQALLFEPRAKGKIGVVYNGVHYDSFANADKQKVAEIKEKYAQPIFLIAGVWREHKNIPGAIAAFELFRKHGGKGKLIITGKEDPYYPEVKQMTEASRFISDIELTGFIDDDYKRALFAAASALIFPSFSEGFGLPALEAMAAGTPVVCSNTSCLPEVCGDAALYFNPHDSEDIALKMVDALDGKIAPNLIEIGRQRAQNFTWEKTAELTGNVFESILDEKNRS
jgi:glycosyltransferase involved in cell wall biosynthesis